MNHTRKMIFGSKDFLDLEQIIKIPEDIGNEKYKIRVLYTENIQEITFELYQPKNIQTIKLLDIDDYFEYQYKSTNRDYFNQLVSENEVDDLILVQNDLITDATFTNLLFFDGVDWITPQQVLLEGTMRQSLLEQRKIKQSIITKDQLKLFQSYKQINAMIAFDEAEEISIHRIIS